MKHQLKAIVHQSISDHGTKTIIANLIQEKNSDDHIKDPDVRAMVEDYRDSLARQGDDTLKILDAKRQMAKQEKTYDVDDLNATEGEKKFEQYQHHQFVKRRGFFSEAEGVDKEWFIPTPTGLPEDDPEYLCHMCPQIDFGILLSKR